MMPIKPLFTAQQQIDHHRHINRLHQIATKKSKYHHSNHPSPQQQNQGSKQHPSLNKITQKKLEISYSNYKLLERLREISERKVNHQYYQSVALHCNKKKNGGGVINPERKRRQQQILEMNNKLVKRLINKQSQFDKNKMMKNIEQYQNIKRILQNNKRVKLTPIQSQSGRYHLTRASSISKIPKPDATILHQNARSQELSFIELSLLSTDEISLQNQ